MMKKVHACLLGQWVCLNDDPNSTIMSQPPAQWISDGARVHAPYKRSEENTYEQLAYVDIVYLGKSYKINPIFIQTTEI